MPVAGSPRLEMAQIVGRMTTASPSSTAFQPAVPQWHRRCLAELPIMPSRRQAARERPDFDDYANGLRLPNRDTPHEEVTRVG